MVGNDTIQVSGSGQSAPTPPPSQTYDYVTMGGQNQAAVNIAQTQIDYLRSKDPNALTDAERAYLQAQGYTPVYEQVPTEYYTVAERASELGVNESFLSGWYQKWGRSPGVKTYETKLTGYELGSSEQTPTATGWQANISKITPNSGSIQLYINNDEVLRRSRNQGIPITYSNGQYVINAQGAEYERYVNLFNTIQDEEYNKQADAWNQSMKNAPLISAEEDYSKISFLGLDLGKITFGKNINEAVGNVIKLPSLSEVAAYRERTFGESGNFLINYMESDKFGSGSLKAISGANEDLYLYARKNPADAIATIGALYATGVAEGVVADAALTGLEQALLAKNFLTAARYVKPIVGIAAIGATGDYLRSATSGEDAVKKLGKLAVGAVGFGGGSGKSLQAYDVLRTKGLKEIPIGTVVSERVLTGEETVPLVGAGKNADYLVRMFEGEGGKVTGYHVNPTGFEIEPVAGIDTTVTRRDVKRPTDVPGLYISPVQSGPSIHFSRVTPTSSSGAYLKALEGVGDVTIGAATLSRKRVGEGLSKLSDTLIGYPQPRKPSTFRIEIPAGVERLPEEIRYDVPGLPEEMNPSREFYLLEGKKGAAKAYITPVAESGLRGSSGRVEAEAAIVPDTRLYKTGEAGYIKYGGRRIKIEEYTAGTPSKIETSLIEDTNLPGSAGKLSENINMPGIEEPIFKPGEVETAARAKQARKSKAWMGGEPETTIAARQLNEYNYSLRGLGEETSILKRYAESLPIVYSSSMPNMISETPSISSISPSRVNISPSVPSMISETPSISSISPSRVNISPSVPSMISETPSISNISPSRVNISPSVPSMISETPSISSISPSRVNISPSVPSMISETPSISNISPSRVNISPSRPSIVSNTPSTPRPDRGTSYPISDIPSMPRPSRETPNRIIIGHIPYNPEPREPSRETPNRIIIGHIPYNPGPREPSYGSWSKVSLPGPSPIFKTSRFGTDKKDDNKKKQFQPKINYGIKKRGYLRNKFGSLDGLVKTVNKNGPKMKKLRLK